MNNFNVQAQSYTNINVTVACCRSLIQGLCDSKKTVNLRPPAAAGVPFDPSGTLSPLVAAAAAR